MFVLHVRLSPKAIYFDLGENALVPCPRGKKAAMFRVSRCTHEGSTRRYCYILNPPMETIGKINTKDGKSKLRGALMRRGQKKTRLEECPLMSIFDFSSPQLLQAYVVDRKRRKAKRIWTRDNGLTYLFALPN